MATTDVTPEKTLPHNLEAERTVLGAVLVDNAAFSSAAEVLTREDFYRESHRRIFEAMAVLAERSQPIDLVTLKNELLRGGALEAAGGAPWRRREGPPIWGASWTASPGSRTSSTGPASSRSGPCSGT